MSQVKQSNSGSLSVGTGSVELLEARSIRRAFVVIGNTHASNKLFLNLGDSATVNEGIFVPANTAVQVNGWNGSINAIASGSSTTVSFMEGFLDVADRGEFGSSSSSSSSGSSESSSSHSSSSSSQSSQGHSESSGSSGSSDSSGSSGSSDSSSGSSDSSGSTAGE